VSVSTIEAIRDRVYTLLESLAPTSLSSDKFRRYRNEAGANFSDWAESQPAAAFRRFQVREVGDDELPDVSDTTTERVTATLEIIVAYPQTHRTGPANAMDRDDVINQDWKSLNASVGIYGRGNFSSSHDCTPLGCTKSVERVGKIDLLVVRMRVEYVRSVT
jgi:hypothetical protein